MFRRRARNRKVPKAHSRHSPQPSAPGQVIKLPGRYRDQRDILWRGFRVWKGERATGGPGGLTRTETSGRTVEQTPPEPRKAVRKDVRKSVPKPPRHNQPHRATTTNRHRALQTYNEGSERCWGCGQTAWRTREPRESQGRRDRQARESAAERIRRALCSR